MNDSQETLAELQVLDSILRLIIEISPELFGLLKEVINSNRRIESRLEILNRKLDNLVVREIQSGLQLIDGLVDIESERMKETHLREAESSLLKNIGLDPNLTTADKPNGYWSAQAYYGLSLIALLRGEEKDAGRFLMQTFIVCPSEARESFGKKLYSETFEPQCQDITEKYDREFQSLSRYLDQIKQIKWDITKKQMEKGGLALMGVVTFFINSPARTAGLVSSHQGVSNVDRQIQQLKTQLSQIPTEETLKSKLEEELDSRCREVARKLLGSKTLDAR